LLVTIHCAGWLRGSAFNAFVKTPSAYIGVDCGYGRDVCKRATLSRPKFPETNDRANGSTKEYYYNVKGATLAP